MISNIQKECFANAFKFYESIMKKHEISQNERELFNLYKDELVREVLEDVIEPVAKVKFIQLGPRQSIYVIPAFDNENHQYNNEELRDLWNLKDNSELYMVQFSMLVLMSMFYNTATQRLTERTSVSLGEYSKVITQYMERLKSMSEELVTQYSEEMELDLKSIVKVWDKRSLIVESAKNPDKAPTGKIGMLNRVLSFLEKEELVVMIGDEIKLTSKMDALIIRYYFNDSRRNELFDFLKSPIFSMKRVENNGHD